MHLIFSHSHAFNGARLTVDEDIPTEATCLVEFSDGVTVVADLAIKEDAIEIGVPSYRTSSGHLVKEARWRIVRTPNGDWKSFRIN